jgi:hypothetical protein
MSTVARLTPSRSAISISPTGSTRKSVEKVLTEGKSLLDNLYMTTTQTAAEILAQMTDDQVWLAGGDLNRQYHRELSEAEKAWCKAVQAEIRKRRGR